MSKGATRVVAAAVTTAAEAAGVSAGAVAGALRPREARSAEVVVPEDPWEAGPPLGAAVASVLQINSCWNSTKNGDGDVRLEHPHFLSTFKRQPSVRHQDRK